MHELALCQEILAILEAEARRRRFTRVRAVRLEVGAFACASPDAIAFCFDAVMHETLADGATLDDAALWNMDFLVQGTIGSMPAGQ